MIPTFNIFQVNCSFCKRGREKGLILLETKELAGLEQSCFLFCAAENTKETTVIHGKHVRLGNILGQPREARVVSSKCIRRIQFEETIRTSCLSDAQRKMERIKK